jgi:MFS family permease
MAILMQTITRNPPASTKEEQGFSNPPGAASPGLIGNIFGIVSSLQIWLVAIIFFGVYGTAVTLQGLWATPFLTAVLNIERILASKLNMLIPIGVIIGAPVFGWLPDRLDLDKKRVFTIVTAAYTLCWLVIVAAFDRLGIVGFAMIFFAIGISIGGFISSIWRIIREIAPAERLGLTSGMINPAPFFGVAVFQVLTGNLLDRAGRVGELYALSGFKSAFSICLAGAAGCLALSLFLKPDRKMMP